MITPETSISEKKKRGVLKLTAVTAAGALALLAGSKPDQAVGVVAPQASAESFRKAPSASEKYNPEIQGLMLQTDEHLAELVEKVKALDEAEVSSVEHWEYHSKDGKDSIIYAVTSPRNDHGHTIYDRLLLNVPNGSKDNLPISIAIEFGSKYLHPKKDRQANNPQSWEVYDRLTKPDSYRITRFANRKLDLKGQISPVESYEIQNGTKSKLTAENVDYMFEGLLFMADNIVKPSVASARNI